MCIETRLMIFETRRLNVRAATLADVDLYDALWNNPRVMAYVGFPDGMRISREEIAEKLSKQGGDIVIVGPNPEVQALISLTRLDKVFDIVGDVSTALERFRHAS